MTGLDRLKATPEGIGTILAQRRLAVPLFQRSYAWTEQNVAELYADVATAVAEGAEEYFLGAIVISAREQNRPEVVDGQQRLATVTLLLAAIRDFFVEAGESDRAALVEEYLFERDIRSLEREPKLKLNHLDDQFFRDAVLARPQERAGSPQPSRKSHRLLLEGAAVARSRVGQVAVETTKPIDRLLDWVQFLRERVRVITVDVPDRANAFVIFETLNDRGLDLSIADLLKNYLFELAGDRLTEVETNWTSMLAALESATSDEIVRTFLRHQWASQHGPTREKELYQKIKKRITAKQHSVDFSNELAEAAGRYAALLNPSHELWEPYGATARQHLAALQLLRMTQNRPLLLAIIARFKLQEARPALRLLVSWAVRSLIVGGVGGGTLEKNYSERAATISKGELQSAAELAEAMAAVVPTDAEFESAFATSRVSQAYLARYYLRALERHVRGEANPELVPNQNEEELNLEHVLPKDATAAWGDLDSGVAEAYHRRIGNLALLQKPINSAIGNQGFEAKKPAFAASALELTRDLATFAAWGPAQINERQSRLAKLATETWPARP